jgi:lysophospholipase L1-like esterase
MKTVPSLLAFLLTAAAAVPAQIKLACVGNSITAGNGSDTGYTARLQKLLGSGYQVQNDGKSGTTLLKHGDVPYWTHDKFPAVFTFKPDIITLKLGTNDTKPQNWDKYKGEFKRDLEAMIDTFATISKKPKIYLVLPVPSWTNTYGIRDSAMKKILVIYRQVASERNLPLIDCNTPLINFQKYFPDGVHPDDPGADTIAHVIYRALTSPTSIALLKPLSPGNAFEAGRGPFRLTFPVSGSEGTDFFDPNGKRMTKR